VRGSGRISGTLLDHDLTAEDRKAFSPSPQGLPEPATKAQLVANSAIAVDDPLHQQFGDSPGQRDARKLLVVGERRRGVDLQTIKLPGWSPS
jgi:hypothetical protein